MKNKNNKNVLPYKTSAELYFRIGVKYEDEKKFIEALHYFIMAAQIQPFNPDYQLNIAGVLTEIGDYKESNRVLEGILKNIDKSLSECYFCMACNYFDLGNLKKAASHFKKYIEASPDGCFVDDAYNALYYLELYDDEFKSNAKSQIILGKDSQNTKKGKVREDNIIYLNSYIKAQPANEFDDYGCLRSDSSNILGEKWQKVINCAMIKREEKYGSTYKHELEDICMNIITRLSSGNKIVIRKYEVWAAVLEYIYCKKMNMDITKPKIADKYNIAVSTITSKLKQIGF